MNEIIVYRDSDHFYYLKQQSFSKLDYLHDILEEIGTRSIGDWINDLLDSETTAKIGNMYGIYKEGSMAYIYHDIYYDNDEEGEEDPYAYRKGFAIQLEQLLIIFKQWVKLKQEQWDEIILQQDDNNEIKLFGRNHDPNIPLVMHFYREEADEDDDECEYHAACAYGRYAEIRIYFIYETQYASKWLAFLKNPQKKRFKGSKLYAQKVDNQVHLCYFKPAVQKKHNLVPDKIDIDELIRLTNEWLEFSKKGAESITLTILHNTFQLNEG